MALTRPDSSQILHRQVNQSARDQRARDNKWAHVSDFATLADALTFSAANGVTIEFDGSATYTIPAGLGTFSTGVRLKTNGCTFQPASTSTSNAYLLDFLGGLTADEINITIPSGIRRDRVIRVSTGPVNVGAIRVNSVDVQSAASETNDNAVRFSSCTGIDVGMIQVTGYEYPVALVDVDNVRIGVTISNYIRGLYLSDAKNTRVTGRISGRSAAAGYTPGHNGILVDATSDDATENVWLDNVICESAGEHGIRLGGAFRIRNLWMLNPYIRGADGTGIKVLGGELGSPGVNYHENIVISNPIVEDSGSSPSGQNKSGISMCYVANAVISNPIIRTRNDATSGHYGILVQASRDVTIDSPLISDTASDGIRIDGQWGDIDRLKINGGSVLRPLGHGIHWTYDSGTQRRIELKDVSVEGAALTGFTISRNSGTGTLNNCRAALSFSSNTGANVASDSTSIAVYLRGGFVDQPALNSSTWTDGTNFKIRKAGAWVNL